MQFTCSNDILVIHTNCHVQRTVEGLDVLFLETVDASDEDQILSLEELGLLRRRVLLISENPIPVLPSLPENVFLLSPLNGKILYCWSIEVAFYQYSLKHPQAFNKRPGKIEDIIRTQGQVYTKFIKNTYAQVLLDDPKIGPFATCPFCFHLLLTHLMSVYFNAWTENKISKLSQMQMASLRFYPASLQSGGKEVFRFLDSLVNCRNESFKEAI